MYHCFAFVHSSLLGARKKGDEGIAAEAVVPASDIPSLPERSFYEKLCRREKNIVVI